MRKNLKTNIPEYTQAYEKGCNENKKSDHNRKKVLVKERTL